tara:strand:+ start:1240 stop:1506 length:267 start_codon:yes stop_codon:yes gene_type:complete
MYWLVFGCFSSRKANFALQIGTVDVGFTVIGAAVDVCSVGDGVKIGDAIAAGDGVKMGLEFESESEFESGFGEGVIEGVLDGVMNVVD